MHFGPERVLGSTLDATLASAPRRDDLSFMLRLFFPLQENYVSISPGRPSSPAPPRSSTNLCTTELLLFPLVPPQMSLYPH